MPLLSFMLIAGEPSGDTLAAELVRGLQQECAELAFPVPRILAAGGPALAAAGAEMVEDMMTHAVFGLVDVLRRYRQFRALLHRLVDAAIQRQPEVIVCVDFSGFNRRFAAALRQRLQAEGSPWRPRIVQFVSPQVWASRAGRAAQMARDFDLLLSIFPFEKAWYAQHAPSLRVEFVGHPMLDRHGAADDSVRAEPPLVLLLPGSRRKELHRHLPPMLDAMNRLQQGRPLNFRMVLPTAELAACARAQSAAAVGLEISVGGLAASLSAASLAIASSGTVTMECAFFGVPTVVLYKLSWIEFQVARRMVKVRHIAMPNLLAGESVFPEFIQHQATGQNLADAARQLLDDAARRRICQQQLRKIIASLGAPGAARRAARAVLHLVA